ncbi:hypothetical protein L1987_36550 [Smallanthus sonchifolius]|uniref:Uncharacterized protein n=1 Tax=Smallanthus sonchifolius TaxID=185202 RepID=A0ACB9HDW8_9ASTR|nr:hypothetical protein L1987_36550 [Smallanthus sonchifolius]
MVKLDKLTFKRGGTCSAKILKKVFDYAFSQGVKELEADIIYSRNNKSWPIWFHTSSDALTSLKLESGSDIGCSFLEPRSGSFKNLTKLHLRRAIITDLDPFSGFPSLEKLTLVYCHLQTDGNTLNIYAPQLSELTISYYNQYVNRCELMTPKLRYFECQGNNFPRLKTHQGGLPVLDTAVIGYNGFCSQNKEKMMFDDLLMLFGSIYNAKSLTVSSSVVHLLTLFTNELVKQCSPFRDLKCLKLDFSSFHYQKLFVVPCRPLKEALRLLPGVKGYLLQKSHDVKCTMICPEDPNAKSPCSRSHASQACVCAQINIL